MNSPTTPRLPVPPPLRGAEVGSFAHRTIIERLPRIARRVLDENEWSEPVVEAVEALIAEIPEGRIRPLEGPDAPDGALWAAYTAPYRDQNWLQVPWFFAETYFYRRILEATGYFAAGPGHEADPYQRQKRQGLDATLPKSRTLSQQLNETALRADTVEAGLINLLEVALWGNQADLSLWPAGSEGQPGQQKEQAEKEAHILVNDATAVAEHLLNGGPRRQRVDLIADNAGFELVTDLCLADFLLQKNVTASVRLHLKPHPTFVSDATGRDVEQTVRFLGTDADGDLQNLANRLRGYLKRDRLELTTDWYWTSPLSGWEMPATVREELAGADLVISKGDANYRRLLGDRHWPFTTPFSDIVAYFPAPVVALRALKSEVAAGLNEEQMAELDEVDPLWRTDGEWGVIQFHLQSA